MEAFKIIHLLEELCNPAYACDWDNVGLHIGNDTQNVQTLLVTVDVDDAAVDKAIETGADMIISHHPLLFRPINQINNSSAIGKRILKIMSNNILCYCMHTNFDIAGGMATVAAEKIGLLNTTVLEVEKDGMGIGQVGYLKEPMSVGQLIDRIKHEFKLQTLVLYGEEDKIVQKIAISPGSGKDEIPYALSAQAEVLVTGDITYHYGTDAIADGLTIIDAGHYGIEHIFIDIVGDYLESHLDDQKIIRMDFNNPQKYI